MNDKGAIQVVAWREDLNAIFLILLSGGAVDSEYVADSHLMIEDILWNGSPARLLGRMTE